MVIERWDPFREMMGLRGAMDRMLEEGFGRQWGLTGQVTPIDLYQTDNEVILKASLPGVRPEDVEITCSGDTCTIRGETKADAQQRREDYLLQERRYGAFSRTVTLPISVQTDQAEATFDHGVLTLRLPKAPEARPHRIQVRGSSSQTGGPQTPRQ